MQLPYILFLATCTGENKRILFSSFIHACVLYLYEKPINAYVEYFQQHIIITILHMHTLVTLVTINRVSHHKNKISMQIIVQKCMLKPLDKCNIK